MQVEPSHRILHVDAAASLEEIDAAYHKWHTFWSVCRSSVGRPEERKVAERELDLLVQAHREMRGATRVSRAELEWFSPVPIKTRVGPPPLPKKRRATPPPLPSRRVAQPLRPIAAILAGAEEAPPAVEVTTVVPSWARPAPQPQPQAARPRSFASTEPWMPMRSPASLHLQVVMVTLAGLCVGAAAALVASAYLQ